MEPSGDSFTALYELLDTPPSAQEIENALIQELRTVQDAVRYLVSCFAAHEIYCGHGTDNYWDEALEIVQAVMHLQPPCDDSTLNSRLTEKERKIIAAIANKRIFLRVPTPYLTHRAFFCGHQFYVDKRVIVPRSPIAELIENGFDPFIDRTPDRVLDMCTGSGCIAIAIALHFDGDCEVDAVDISEEALEVAEINIRGSTMPKEFEAEPELALGSGEDGLDCARKILAQAVDYLSDDGVLIMEVGNSAENLNDAFPHVPFHFIDLKKGGGGVFLLTAEQLKAYSDVFKSAL